LAKIHVNGSKPIPRSSTTADHKKAKEYEQALNVEIRQRKKSGVKSRSSWMKAVLKYLDEAVHKPSQDTDKLHLI
jgi:hypothetical protein